MLASIELDSRSILTVLLAGDERLVKRLQSEELMPMASRIRYRLRCEAVAPQQLKDGLLNHLKNWLSASARRTG